MPPVPYALGTLSQWSIEQPHHYASEGLGGMQLKCFLLSGPYGNKTLWPLNFFWSRKFGIFRKVYSMI